MGPIPVFNRREGVFAVADDYDFITIHLEQCLETFSSTRFVIHNEYFLFRFHSLFLYRTVPQTQVKLITKLLQARTPGTSSSQYPDDVRFRV